MTSSSETGVLLYAFGNSLIDYYKLANYATDLVHRHLDLPVCLVTDNQDLSFNADYVVAQARETSVGTRFFHDYGKPAEWHNVGRETGLELSPFRFTLALDVDYLVLGNTLRKFVGRGIDLMVPRSSYELGEDHTRTYTTLGGLGLPAYWATIVSWDRDSILAQQFFAAWQHVKKHWVHYTGLFGINGSLFRNDYAVTLALYLIQGKVWSRDHDMPYTMINLKSKSTILDVHTAVNGYVDVAVYSNQRPVRVNGYDVHAMNKKNLMEQLNG